MMGVSLTAGSEFVNILIITNFIMFWNIFYSFIHTMKYECQVVFYFGLNCNSLMIDCIEYGIVYFFIVLYCT